MKKVLALSLAIVSTVAVLYAVTMCLSFPSAARATSSAINARPEYRAQLENRQCFAIQRYLRETKAGLGFISCAKNIDNLPLPIGCKLRHKAERQPLYIASCNDEEHLLIEQIDVSPKEIVV